LVKKQVKILQFSDTHIRQSQNFNKNAFLKAVEHINNQEVDYIIHLGDVTDEGTIEDYELAKKLLSKIKKEVIYIIGNHDARNVGYELFEEYFGPITRVFHDDQVMIAGFDSTIPDRNIGRFGALSLEALKKVLKIQSEPRIRVVAFHHHLLPVPRAGRERSMIVDSGDVLKVILDHNVDLVLNGHRHSPNIYKIANLMVVNSGTISHYKTRGRNSYSFNIIKISPYGKYEVKVCKTETETQERFIKKVKKEDRQFKETGKQIARIVQISNTHFTDSSEFLTETYNRAVQRINQLNPDLVVHCGNVTKDGLADQFELAIKELSKILKPKLIVPGPHDLLNLGYRIFQRRIGDLDPIFTGENKLFAVYGINSSQYEEHDGLIGRRHLRYLIKKLSEPKKNQVKIVAFHHHILPLPQTREKYPIEDAGEVLKELTNINLDMILTGHRHVSNAQCIEKTTVVNASTLSSKRVLADHTNTFNLIEIQSNGTAIIFEIKVATGMKKFLGFSKLPSLTGLKKE